MQAMQDRIPPVAPHTTVEDIVYKRAVSIVIDGSWINKEWTSMPRIEVKYENEKTGGGKLKFDITNVYF